MKNSVVKLSAKKQLRVVGLMSGTSVDGVDVAICDIDKNGARLVAFDTFAYRSDLRKKIFALFDPDSCSVDNLCSLNFVLGEVFAKGVIDLCKQSKIPLKSIDLIGSHGQTIYHDPKGVRFQKRSVGSTLQIAGPAVIAHRTGITTIADFRTADMAVGGEGAPLVPFADYFLFRDRKKGRAIQNIGGIANVTYLPANCKISDVIAFDTGAGNMVIDRAVVLSTKGKKHYDKNGKIANGGCVNETLLKQLMKHPFLRRKPPKSTGREEFGTQYTDALYKKAVKNKLVPADIVATVTAFTAHCIAYSYRRFLPALPDEIILCGGGAHNKTLVKMLKEMLKETKLSAMDEFGIDIDAKEALSFAILAYHTIKGLASNVPSATGAEKPVILGKIVQA
jgi:anhydro-N-acetylmuramic acid kinase